MSLARPTRMPRRGWREVVEQSLEILDRRRGMNHCNQRIIRDHRAALKSSSALYFRFR